MAIARAVYWNAKLMIMDEPTNNLGVPEQRKVLDLIRRLRDQGVPVILITHTLHDVFAVADRLMVMHRGRKVTEKKTAETNSDETRPVHGRCARTTRWSSRQCLGGGMPMHGRKWVTLTGHRTWLLARANELLDFFEGASIDPAGGFRDLDDHGRPLTGVSDVPYSRQVQATSRMVHCYAMARLMGRPGADAMIDHGMDFLWNGHRDRQNGGYFWAMGDDGPIDDSKQAYGHAFVLLAAASAKAAGHPDADRLLADVTAVINERFWEEQYGAVAEEFTRDWQPKSTYRGQNANMHLTEAPHGGLRGDRRSLLSRQGRAHRRSPHPPGGGRQWLAVAGAFHRGLAARTPTMSAIPCSTRPAPRPAIRSNGRG